MSRRRACPRRSRPAASAWTARPSALADPPQEPGCPAAMTTSISCYAAEVELPDERPGTVRSRLGPDVQPYVPERFDWPEPGSRPLEHRPVIVGAGPGRADRRLPAGRARLSPLDPGTRPGRQGPRRRRPPVRRGGAARPRKQLPLRRGGRRHLQRRQAHLARHRARRAARPGNPRRMPRQAVDPLRASAAPRVEPPAAGRPHPAAQVRGSWAARSGSRAGSRTSIIADGRLRGS